MPVVTAAQVVQYTDITATAATIISSGLISVVQDRINQITNNWFTTELQLQTAVTFDPDDRTITTGSNNWAKWGFADGDEIYIYRSYRNDGYKVVETVSEKVLTVTTAYSVVAELSGQSILFSVVQWPASLAYVAAQMVAYDYDSRGDHTPGLKSQSLGPWSESYSQAPDATPYGYPKDLVDMLRGHAMVRLM